LTVLVVRIQEFHEEAIVGEPVEESLLVVAVASVVWPFLCPSEVIGLR
jgi:hypothetical protein